MHARDTSREVTVTPKEYSRVRLKHDRTWWNMTGQLKHAKGQVRWNVFEGMRPDLFFYHKVQTAIAFSGSAFDFAYLWLRHRLQPAANCGPVSGTEKNSTKGEERWPLQTMETSLGWTSRRFYGSDQYSVLYIADRSEAAQNTGRQMLPKLTAYTQHAVPTYYRSYC